MEKKMKVILSEDDENLGSLLREYLIAKGYDTDLYPDGEAAFKGFQKNQYDLCIFDVMMESFSPTIAFIKVDFPTFGFPIMLTNPDLCAIVPVIIPKIFAKIVISG